MNKKVIIVIGIVLLVIIIIVSAVFILNEKKYKGLDIQKSISDKMEDVDYVILSYSGDTKRLNNKIAEIISKTDIKDFKEKTRETKETTETGEQEYIFRFYDENEELLCQIQYKETSEKVTLYDMPFGKGKIYNINFLKEVQK